MERAVGAASRWGVAPFPAEGLARSVLTFLERHRHMWEDDDEDVDDDEGEEEEDGLYGSPPRGAPAHALAWVCPAHFGPAHFGPAHLPPAVQSPPFALAGVATVLFKSMFPRPDEDPFLPSTSDYASFGFVPSVPFSPSTREATPTFVRPATTSIPNPTPSRATAAPPPTSVSFEYRRSNAFAPEGLYPRGERAQATPSATKVPVHLTASVQRAMGCLPFSFAAPGYNLNALSGFVLPMPELNNNAAHYELPRNSAAPTSVVNMHFPNPELYSMRNTQPGVVGGQRDCTHGGGGMAARNRHSNTGSAGSAFLASSTPRSDERGHRAAGVLSQQLSAFRAQPQSQPQQTQPQPQLTQPQPQQTQLHPKQTQPHPQQTQPQPQQTQPHPKQTQPQQTHPQPQQTQTKIQPQPQPSEAQPLQQPQPQPQPRTQPQPPVTVSAGWAAFLEQYEWLSRMAEMVHGENSQQRRGAPPPSSSP